jgi:hypothetical protein
VIRLMVTAAPRCLTVLRTDGGVCTCVTRSFSHCPPAGSADGFGLWKTPYGPVRLDGPGRFTPGASAGLGPAITPMGPRLSGLATRCGHPRDSAATNRRRRPGGC